MADPSEEPQVDNPIYQQLIRLRDDVRRIAGDVGAALDPPTASMGSGRVWTGPTARNWERDLSGRKGSLSQAASRLEADVNAVLSQTSPKVSASTARMINKGLL